MYFVFVLILVIILIYINQSFIIEKFYPYQTFQSFVPANTYKYPNFLMGLNPNPNPNAYTNLPWWNTPFGNTTNMSYDLRGDPLVIPRTIFPWNNSSIYPIYNQSV